MESVSEILRVRAQTSANLEHTISGVVSLLAHGAIAVMLVLAAPAWRGRQEIRRTVMTISLGGAPGPRNGGLMQNLDQHGRNVRGKHGVGRAGR